MPEGDVAEYINLSMPCVREMMAAHQKEQH